MANQVQDFGFVPEAPTPAGSTPANQFGFVPDTPAPAFHGAGGSWTDETSADRMKSLAAGGINMVGTALGQGTGAALGTMVEPGGGTVLGGMAGGAAGAYGAGKLNQALGLSAPATAGDIEAATIGGMVPGESLVGASLGKLARAGTGAAIANMGATTAQSLADEGSMPTKTQLLVAAGGGYAGTALGKALDTGKNIARVVMASGPNATEDATLAAGRAAGYVIPTFETNDSAAQKAIGSIGGKAATKQQATIMNQATTNRLAKQEIGLPVNKPITEDAIQAVQDKAYAPYQKIAQISQSSAQDLSEMRAQWLNSGDPHQLAIAADDPLFKQLAGHLDTVSQADVNALRDARKGAKAAWQKFNMGGGAAEQKAAEDASSAAQALEDKIGNAAQAIGDPQLLAQLQQARTLLAKTHVIEGATNFANGEVNAGAIGNLYKKGQPLTGNLETIGKMQQAFPNYTSLGSRTPAPDVNALTPVLMAAGAAVGGGESHSAAKGAAAGVAIPIARYLARKTMLSQPVQSGMLSTFARPNYGSAPPDLAALLGKYAAMTVSRPQSIPPYLAAGSATQ